MKATIMADGRIILPLELRQRHGLVEGADIIVEEVGGAIVLRTLDQIVARAQALSLVLIAGRPAATVDDFLADRAEQARLE